MWKGWGPDEVGAHNEGVSFAAIEPVNNLLQAGALGDVEDLLLFGLLAFCPICPGQFGLSHLLRVGHQQAVCHKEHSFIVVLLQIPLRECSISLRITHHSNVEGMACMRLVMSACMKRSQVHLLLLTTWCVAECLLAQGQLKAEKASVLPEPLTLIVLSTSLHNDTEEVNCMMLPAVEYDKRRKGDPKCKCKKGSLTPAGTP